MRACTSDRVPSAPLHEVEHPQIPVAGVQPLAYLVEPERLLDGVATEWVTGIVTANPFHTVAVVEPQSSLPVGLELIQDSEHLICDLAEHHMLDDLDHYTYALLRFESARTSEALVCRPIANWSREHDAAPDKDKPPQRTLTP